jgi:hypothetical protein
MKVSNDSYFFKIKNPEWVRKKRLHYLMMPQWADGKCIIVIILALVSLVCGMSSCFFLLHSELFEAFGHVGRTLWFAGFVALLTNMYFYLRGLYRKFQDKALDAFY